MPIYEYQCEKCGVIIEKIQKFSDAPLTSCDRCEGKLNKLLSQSSFSLKGSGWYLTDYSKKTSSKAEPKTETKTETKAETPCATTGGGCGAGACATSTDN